MMLEYVRARGIRVYFVCLFAKLFCILKTFIHAYFNSHLKFSVLLNYSPVITKYL